MWKTDEEWLLDEKERLKKQGLGIDDRKLVLNRRYELLYTLPLISFLMGLFVGMVFIVLMR